MIPSFVVGGTNPTDHNGNEHYVRVRWFETYLTAKKQL